METWDINGTISELSYHTHNYLRYYGKFPPPVATNLINRFTKEGETVLDNFVGCGTTLVEARILSRNSIGVDINPLGVLASKVKATPLDVQVLKDQRDRLVEKIVDEISSFRKNGTVPLLTCLPKFPRIDYWFDKRQQVELGILKHHILDLKDNDIKDFFLVGFASIIRRASKAYDGEVRPHINPDKKQKKVFETFAKKTEDMIERMGEFNKYASKSVYSKAYVGDSRDLEFIDDESVDLIVSHPSYLNVFDYAPVFRLEILWLGFDYTSFKKNEIRAWPATDKEIVGKYLEGMEGCFSEMFRVLRKGRMCGVLIGDTTIRKKTFPTHKYLIDIAEKLGFSLHRTIRRKTYYGTGRYSYDPKALKEDYVLVFKKE